MDIFTWLRHDGEGHEVGIIRFRNGISIENIEEGEKEMNKVAETKKPEVNLASPWVEHFAKIEAMFAEDPDVTTVFDNENCKCKILVHGHDKADAIAALMPEEVVFGNVTMTIEVVPDNTLSSDPAAIIEKAFAGNPAFKRIIKDEFCGFKMIYAVFKMVVVQYKNDDIGDPFKRKATLYENLARDVFKKDLGVFYATDLAE